MKRRIVLLVLLFAALFSLAAPAASAETKSYSVPSAEFFVRLNADGSADIREDWTLHFSQGSFTRFYKDVYTDVSYAEEFSALTDLEVYIDGQPCKQTNDTSKRPDYRFHRSDGYNKITLEA